MLEGFVKYIRGSVVMIKSQCDLCKQNKNNLKTIVLHKKTFDYCKECENKAKKIREEFKKVIKLEYIKYESNLKKAEDTFFKDRIKK